MKVVLTSHSAAPGGAELSMLHLATAIRRRPGVECELLLFEEGPMLDEAARCEVPCTSIPLPASVGGLRRGRPQPPAVGDLIGVPRFARELARAIRRSGADVVHSNSLKSHLLAGVAARRARVPCLWHLREPVAPPNLSAAESAVLRRLWRLPSAIVANSAGVARSYGDAVAAVITPGVPTVRYADVPDLPTTVPDELVVCCVSRLAELKGQHVLIDAARRLASEGVDATVLLAGAPLFGADAYMEELRRRADGLNCRFLGHLADVRTALARSHVVAVPSVHPEGFGKVVVEGLAAGRPVIASAHGGAAEILDGPLRGWLVPPGDERALARKLRDLVDNWPATVALTTPARRRAARFDVEVAVDAALAIYARLAQGARSETASARRAGRAATLPTTHEG